MFLGSIEAPVPSSRPGIVRAAARGGRVKSAACGGPGATRSRGLAASMARTHDLSRLSAVPCFGQSVVTRQSVTAIAERRLHCGNGIQIEIDHLLKHSICSGSDVH